MLGLDDPRWNALDHAYGPAGDVPDLLRAVERGEQELWDELVPCLCHQGTVYTASYAALPHIVTIARTRDPQDGYDPLLLAGSIELARLERRGPPIPEDLAEPYHAAVAEAKALAGKALERASDDDSRLAFAGSLAALSGDAESARAIFDADGDLESSDGAA